MIKASANLARAFQEHTTRTLKQVVEVERKPGQRTCFKVVLPMVAAKW